MCRRALMIAASLAGCLVSASAALGAPPPQRHQSDAAFAGSFAAKGVVNVSATTQRVSCYAPETLYLDALTPAVGYLDGGGSACSGAATTDEELGPYATQDVANPALRVKDHSESEASMSSVPSLSHDRALCASAVKGHLRLAALGPDGLPLTASRVGAVTRPGGHRRRRGA